MGELLVRGGTLVDGTGAPPRRADVRVRDGRVVEIAPGLEPDGETVVDAAGAYVAPGYANGIMPGTYGGTLSAQQLADLVAFLTQSS